MEESQRDFVISELGKAKGHWPKVAEGSGVSKRTIEKIARKEIKNPRVHHIEQLYRYFRNEI